MFGVSINHSIPLSALKRIISLCVGTIIITWSLATNASSIFQWEPDPYKGKWIKVFSKLIGPLANIWVAANLFWFAHVQWKSLWRTVTNIELALGFDQSFYRTLRKASITAVLMLLSVNECQIFSFQRQQDLSH